MKENLELLAKRFDAMASAREEVAAKKRWSDCERESVAMVPLESCMEFPGFHPGCLPCLFRYACCIFHLGHIRHRLF